jgi:hypothetical protein
MEEMPPPRLLSRREALAQGWSDDELGRLTQRAEWTRLRRGAYLDARPPREEIARHRLLVQATLDVLGRPAVVSHQSAAVLWGIPLWGLPLDRVHVTRRPGASTGASRSLHVHVARLPDDDIGVVDGLVVTGPVRTVLDVVRSAPLDVGVVVLDAALRTGVVDAGAVRRGLHRLAGIRGSRHATRAVELADGRSESVGESRSRVLLHRLGLAPSDLQFEVRTREGVLLGRTDFVWEAQRVVGEFDGRIKYGRLLRPGQQPGDVVFEEKRREDLIRDEQWGFVRWTWDDLLHPARLGERVGRAHDRSRRQFG